MKLKTLFALSALVIQVSVRAVNQLPDQSLKIWMNRPAENWNEALPVDHRDGARHSERQYDRHGAR